MLELSNVHKLFSVEDSNDTVKLNIEADVANDKSTFKLTGTFSDLEGTFVGTLYYEKTSEGKGVKSINIDFDKLESAESLLTSVLEEIKSEL